ncbi:ribonuclease Z [Apibacter muscae]|uniref:ribonuclease Z n=1 Tax=Apibacter muscae TaxID=2509004 RepID=UPI0011ACD541|nr:ribonuclease Z [Apibacter muscae]TWP27595.1 ribonuclease Z [Apibacter muscae]
MKLTILGFNSAIPTINSHPSAQLLDIQENLFLIDCGEGTQVQLRRAKAKFSKINHIFISHLHGDHVFGLIGLISTFLLLGRENILNIYGPKGIKMFIENQLSLTESYQIFKLNFIELSSTDSQLIYEDNKLTVHTIPLDHRVYTNGFIFKEKAKPKRLNIESINQYPQIEVCDYHNLKLGKDWVSEDGKTIISNEKLTYEAKHSYSYAYCSDTSYKPDIIDLIKDVDVLYHESTFLNDLEDLARKTKHSTALEAAKIAKEAKVKHLILGHFSNRYSDFSVFKEEAETIFASTLLPSELETIDFEKM